MHSRVCDCLAYFLSLKRGALYCNVMAWLFCCISFRYFVLQLIVSWEHASIVAAQSTNGLLMLPWHKF